MTTQALSEFETLRIEGSTITEAEMKELETPRSLHAQEVLNLSFDFKAKSEPQDKEIPDTGERHGPELRKQKFIRISCGGKPDQRKVSSACGGG